MSFFWTFFSYLDMFNLKFLILIYILLVLVQNSIFSIFGLEVLVNEQLKIPYRKSQERTSKTWNLKPKTDEGFSLQLPMCSIYHHSKDINTGLCAVPSTNNDIHYGGQEVGRRSLLSLRCNKETRGRRWGEIAVRDCRNLSSFLPWMCKTLLFG